MFFCYVDESGDPGKYDANNVAGSGSRFFIMAGLVVNAGTWRPTFNTIRKFRKCLSDEAYLDTDIEIHCAEIVDPRRMAVLRRLSVSERWDIIRRFAELIGERTDCKLIVILIDKATSKVTQEHYLTTAITSLYEAFDAFLKEAGAQGMVFFDRTNEKPVTAHARKLTGTGVTGKDECSNIIKFMIEEPVYLVSSASYFIQAADTVAYTFKEQEFPNASRKKYNADRIFKNMLSRCCWAPPGAGKDGIIRL